ncbi:hypothetical protein MPSEU_000187700 [Mayamaea pseudoterrestris]|nr:hypothetical protein MPSEU_000187700 [Mayamaea pseudoterrestris]
MSSRGKLKFPEQLVRRMFGDDLGLFVMEQQATTVLANTPIDVLGQIETAAMSLNRICPNFEITRCIVDWHNEDLIQDGLCRISRIGTLMEEVKPVRSELQYARVQEIVQYLQLYRNNETFVLNAMAALSLMALNSEKFVNDILSRTIHIFMEIARRQVYPNGIGFVALLSVSALKSPYAFNATHSDRWPHQLLDPLLDLGLVDLLLDALADAVAANRPEHVFRFLHPSFNGPMMYLEIRRAHPQYERHSKLEQGFEVIQNLLQIDEDDERDDEDGNIYRIDSDLDYYYEPAEFWLYDSDDNDDYDYWWR